MGETSESGQRIADEVIKLITSYGLDVVGAVVILVLGWIAAGWSERSLGRVLGRGERVDETLRKFFGSLTIPFPQRDLHLIQAED